MLNSDVMFETALSREAECAVLMWVVRLLFCVKLLPHISQGKACGAVEWTVLMCLVRLLFSVKRLSQILQGKADGEESHKCLVLM